MKTSPFARIVLLLAALLAAWQVAVGIDGLASVPVAAYTVAFGVLLVAFLLLIILGLGVLESPVVVVVSTVIPLSLSLGLVWEYLETWRTMYAAFAIIGLLAVLVTRSLPLKGKLPVFVLAVVHGVSGLVIFLLPAILAANGTARAGFALVGLGGALIGLGGLLLSFLKAGKPILPGEMILRILPALLLLMTAAFVAGFAWR